MYKTTKTRARVERRYRLQRKAWLKKNAATILCAAVLVIMASVFAYIFWYNYMPTNVAATNGKAKIYIDYTVKSGDTLDGISNRYYKDYGYDRPCSFENEVINLNNLHGRINYLEVGQVIDLPKIVNAEVYEVHRIK
jgi:hypothetical protein